MALASYADLQAAVLSWLHIDEPATAAVVPDWITLAEETISRDLADCPAMWATVQGIALGAGQSSFNLPAAAIGLQRVRITTDGATELRQVPASLIFTQEGPTAAGRPTSCAMLGNAGASGAPTVITWPVADKAYSVDAVYQSALPPLSAGLNFVFAKAPSVYLFATLIEAAPYIGHDERISLWMSRYHAAVDAFRQTQWEGHMTLSTEIGAGGGFNFQTGG